MRNFLGISTAIIVLIVLFPAPGFSTSLKVTWNANPETDLAGYRLYWGTQSKNYTMSADVLNSTSCNLDEVQGGTTYYIALSAFDYSGNESARSSEKSIYVPYSITLVSPSEGEDCLWSPVLAWSGNGFKSYRVFISITGLVFNQVYSGSSSYTTLDPILVWMFIPPFATVKWYVEGTTLSGQKILSRKGTFVKK